MGFIDKKYADHVDHFYQIYMGDFLNFHRPCMYPKVTITAGKKRKYTMKLRPLSEVDYITELHSIFI